MSDSEYQALADYHVAWHVAWQALLAVADCRRRAGTDTGFGPDRDAAVVAVSASDSTAWVRRSIDGSWVPGLALPEPMRDLVELYLPLMNASARAPVVVGHLGQSVDACIATPDGDSTVVTGAENFLHLHRMRALCDAIVVGGGTAAADDPQLTTRQVDGPNPVRVVIDPACTLPRHLKIFSDGAASTVLVCGQQATLPAHLDEDRVLRVPVIDAQLSLQATLDGLQARGLHAVFVEGGGVTVTRWMQAGLLTRLQIAAAPILVGLGRPALQLDPVLRMCDARRPAHRLYRMGEDVFWDFDLLAQLPETGAQPPAPAGLKRLL